MDWSNDDVPGEITLEFHSGGYLVKIPEVLQFGDRKSSEFFIGGHEVQLQKGDAVLVRWRKWSPKHTRPEAELRAELTPSEYTDRTGELLDRVQQHQGVDAELQKKRSDLAALELQIKSKIVEAEAASALLAEAKGRQQDLEQRERQIESEDARLVRALLGLNQPPRSLSIPAVTELPPNLMAKLAEAAAEEGLSYEQVVLRRTLVSILLGRVAGCLVMLGGPPGAGKSSLVGLVSRALVGVDATMLAVRPEWLDASDLLGFLIPGRADYQPTPFTSAVQSSGRSAIDLVVLDEMNLGRIENYGADLLTELERSRTREVSLSLYDERQLAGLVGRAQAGDEELLEELRRLQELFPPSIAIPASLVVVGTLNDDETTHALSPKVLDRSVGVRVEYKASDTLFREPLRGSPPASEAVDLKDLRDLLESAFNELQHGELGHELRSLDVAWSHRLEEVLRAVPVIAPLVGSPSHELVEDALIVKLLPSLMIDSLRVDAAERCEQLARGSGWTRFADEIEGLRTRVQDTGRALTWLQ